MVPKTSAERASTYRAKRKQSGFHEIDKEKSRLRVRRYRNNLKADEKQYKVYLASEAAKKKRLRAANKKIVNSDQHKHAAYKTKETLEKAVAKASRNLPHSLLKKRAVIEELAKQVGLKVIDPTVHHSPTKIVQNEMTDEIVKFYNDDDISYQLSNIKTELDLQMKLEEQ